MSESMSVRRTMRAKGGMCVHATVVTFDGPWTRRRPKAESNVWSLRMFIVYTVVGVLLAARVLASAAAQLAGNKVVMANLVHLGLPRGIVPFLASCLIAGGLRSEERRVGKECRSRWWTEHEKKNKEE